MCKDEKGLHPEKSLPLAIVVASCHPETKLWQVATLVVVAVKDTRMMLVYDG